MSPCTGKMMIILPSIVPRLSFLEYSGISRMDSFFLLHQLIIPSPSRSFVHLGFLMSSFLGGLLHCNVLQHSYFMQYGYLDDKLIVACRKSALSSCQRDMIFFSQHVQITEANPTLLGRSGMSP